MKKLGVVFIILFSTLFYFANSIGAVELADIHIEWTYEKPQDKGDIDAFMLYEAGIDCAGLIDPVLEDGTYIIDVTFETAFSGQTVNFTLTTVFADNSESPHSPPYAFLIEGTESGLPFLSIPEGLRIDSTIF